MQKRNSLIIAFVVQLSGLAMLSGCKAGEEEPPGVDPSPLEPLVLCPLAGDPDKKAGSLDVNLQELCRTPGMANSCSDEAPCRGVDRLVVSAKVGGACLQKETPSVQSSMKVEFCDFLVGMGDVTRIEVVALARGCVVGQGAAALSLRVGPGMGSKDLVMAPTTSPLTIGAPGAASCMGVGPPNTFYSMSKVPVTVEKPAHRLIEVQPPDAGCTSPDRCTITVPGVAAADPGLGLVCPLLGVPDLAPACAAPAVSFSLKDYSLDLSKTGMKGTLKVTCPQGGCAQTECGPEPTPCKKMVLKALTTVQVEAIPADSANDQIERWPQCSGTVSGGVCTLVMEGDGKVEVLFAKKPRSKLTIKKAGTGDGTVRGSGGISCGPGCRDLVKDYPVDAVVALDASPSEANFHFDGFSGDCMGSGLCPLRMDRDRTVTATFSCWRTCRGGTKDCGSDGCGGSCGSGICSGVHEECIDGECTCVPHCSGFSCSPNSDGCGGSCDCAPGLSCCPYTGSCVDPSFPCGGCCPEMEACCPLWGGCAERC